MDGDTLLVTVFVCVCDAMAVAVTVLVVEMDRILVPCDAVDVRDCVID